MCELGNAWTWGRGTQESGTLSSEVFIKLLWEPEKSKCQETKERYKIRVCFFEKIQDWNFQFEIIRKWKNPFAEWILQFL